LLAKSKGADLLAREKAAGELPLDCLLFASHESLHVLIVAFLVDDCFFFDGIR
jgi:hypothetical protein